MDIFENHKKLNEMWREESTKRFELEQAIDRARFLHRGDEAGRCIECSDANEWEPYPCPTVKALDGEKS